jgi:hypothetical protein
MHVIRHQMAFNNLAFLLPGQRVEDRTQLPSRLSENRFPTPFGHENYVVLWQQSENVVFEQSRNVVLTAPSFGDAGRTTTDDAGR